MIDPADSGAGAGNGCSKKGGDRECLLELGVGPQIPLENTMVGTHQMQRGGFAKVTR